MAESWLRRDFLRAGAVTPLAAAAFFPSVGRAQSSSPNEQLVFGFIGAGIRFHPLIHAGCNFGPCAAVCDVDAVQRGRGVESARRQHEKHGYPLSIYNYEDYRSVLDRDDIDAVVIATPDHWHAKIAIEAMHAGKDVYCEKPLTLTIREGRQIADAVRATKRVLQVGTQQRTEFGERFAMSAALVREGRIGQVERVTCGVGGSLTSGPIPKAPVPQELNWDKWLGQAPYVDYRATPTIFLERGYGAGHPASRTHNYFRWWYEYSGGKLTDWGAHHVDIALWALNLSGADIGPFTVDPLSVTHPCDFDSNGYPLRDNCFNTATKFHTRVTFSGGVELDVRDSADDLGFGNGVMFQGDKGRFFVNRGKLTGTPVEQLATDPLPEDALEKLYGRRPPSSHMGDFVDCVKTRQKPVSDVESHHRHLTVCHAVNIAMRLNRKLTFDPKTERFVRDPQANAHVAREQRKGFEVVA